MKLMLGGIPITLIDKLNRLSDLSAGRGTIVARER